MLSDIKQNPFKYASYLDLMLFIEIINLMFVLLVAYGKFISIISGILLSLCLSLLIILLYLQKEYTGVIQLFIIDIHIGISIPFIIFFIIYFDKAGFFNFLMPVYRLVMICLESLFIVFYGNGNFSKYSICKSDERGTNK